MTGVEEHARGVLVWDRLPMCDQLRLNRNRFAFGLALRPLTAVWDVVESAPQRTEEADVPIGPSP